MLNQVQARSKEGTTAVISPSLRSDLRRRNQLVLGPLWLAPYFVSNVKQTSFLPPKTRVITDRALGQSKFVALASSQLNQAHVGDDVSPRAPHELAADSKCQSPKREASSSGVDDTKNTRRLKRRTRFSASQGCPTMIFPKSCCTRRAEPRPRASQPRRARPAVVSARADIRSTRPGARRSGQSHTNA